MWTATILTRGAASVDGYRVGPCRHIMRGFLRASATSGAYHISGSVAEYQFRDFKRCGRDIMRCSALDPEMGIMSD